MNVEQELEKITERNKRVEADKAWEGSWTRRVFIMLITYVIALAWLIIINELSAPLKAVVPVAGYILSTLTLPSVKNWWIKKHTN